MKGKVEFSFYMSIGLGMAMATSAYTMIADLFAIAGPLWVLAGVVLSAVFCMIIALSIGELASMFPSAPGVRTYFKIAFGDQISLALVYLYLIFVILIAGLETFVFSQVVLAIFPGSIPVLTVFGVIAFVLVINLVGFQLPRSVQIGTTMTAIALIMVSGTVALFHSRINIFSPAHPVDGWRPLLALPALAGTSIFLYTGFEWVTPLGLRPSAYQRKIPFSMPAVVLVLCAVYSFFVLGAASQLPPHAIAATPTPQIGYFTAIYSGAGPYVALGLSVLSLFSTFNAGVLGGSQLIYMLARERKLPAWCGVMSLRTGCPVGAIFLLAGLATLAGITVVTFRLEILAGLVGASIMCFVYAAFMLAVVRLRKQKPEMARNFRTPVMEAIQWALTAILLLMGIGTLFSGAGYMRCVIGLLLSVLVAWILSLRSGSSGALEKQRAAS
jgi:amino acid transporter